MNYEVKSVAPLAVFMNAIRIFVLIGFIVALISFFVLPNPNIRISSFGQRILATLLFTAVYSVVVSLVLSLVAFLYNFWAGRFKGVTLRLEQRGE
jgi:hypothetical protein